MLNALHCLQCQVLALSPAGGVFGLTCAVDGYLDIRTGENQRRHEKAHGDGLAKAPRRGNAAHDIVWTSQSHTAMFCARASRSRLCCRDTQGKLAKIHALRAEISQDFPVDALPRVHLE